MHHYFQTVLNMFQIWCNNIWTCSKGDAMKLNYCITFLAYVPWLSWPGLACSNDIMTKSSKIIASCFSKQVWACLRYDAIQQNYCIIIFKQFSTCLEYDAIKTKYCITISNSFEHVLNMMQSKQIIASLLSMLSNKFIPVQKMMQSKQIIVSLFSNSFEHIQNIMQSIQIIASLFSNSFEHVSNMMQ